MILIELVLWVCEDRSSMQALSKRHRILGFDNGVGTCIRMCDGIGYIHAHRYIVVVPFRIGVSDEAAVQPSIQQGSSDFYDSCWKEGQRQASDCLIACKTNKPKGSFFFFLFWNLEYASIQDFSFTYVFIYLLLILNVFQIQNSFYG